MFAILTELLMHNQIKFEKGSITIFGRPSSLLPTDSFVNLQKQLEKAGHENSIYYASKESGRLWFEEMNRTYSLKGKDVIMWGSNIVTLAGWGEAVITKRDDAEKVIVFNLKNSMTVKIYGPTDHAVDHLFRGLLCGAMSAIYKVDLDCVETQCVAKGDPICEFLVKPSEKFDQTNPLVKKQLQKVLE